MKKLIAIVLALCMISMLGAAALAEEGTVSKPDGYPKGNVSWIVPGPAGAILDVVTRALAEQTDLGGTIVVENIPGAGHSIGHAEAASREGDGLTMLTCSLAGMIVKPATSELTYDMNSFRHVAMMAPPVSLVACVRPESSVKTAEDWMAMITSGERFTYSHSSGVGGIGHLACLKIFPELGATGGEFIPYSGSAEMLAAVLNGEIDWALIDANEALVKSNSGELVPIVTFYGTPWPGLEEVPCITEYGIPAETLALFMGYKWVAVPKDTPDEVVEWMAQQINAAVQSEEYRDYLVNSGLGTLEEEWTEADLTALLTNAREVYTEILQELGLAAK